MTDCKNCKYTDEYCASGDCTLGDNNLTEQMHKGELPYAEYYIKLGGGEYTNDVWDVGGWQSFNKKGDVVVEVLAPVPSYDEWKAAQEQLHKEGVWYTEISHKKVLEENAQLKELLRECKRQFEEVELCRYDVADTDQEDWFKISTEQADIANKMIAKIDEVLK